MTEKLLGQRSKIDKKARRERAIALAEFDRLVAQIWAWEQSAEPFSPEEFASARYRAILLCWKAAALSDGRMPGCDEKLALSEEQLRGLALACDTLLAKEDANA